MPIKSDDLTYSITGKINKEQEIYGKINNHQSIQGKIDGSQEVCGIISNTILRGYSAYDVAILNGYKGTEEEWLASLHGKDGIDGINGVDGKGVNRIEKTSSFNNIDTYTIYYSDNTIGTFEIKNGINGINGKNGRGIVRVAKTSSSNNIDIYTIYYSDATTSNFFVTNGINGEKGAKGDKGDTPDLTGYATEQWVTDQGYLIQHQDISGKADKAMTYTKNELDIILSTKAGAVVATSSTDGLMSSIDKNRLDELYADYSSALAVLGVN